VGGYSRECEGWLDGEDPVSDFKLTCTQIMAK
jgi:hypothetical protein